MVVFIKRYYLECKYILCLFYFLILEKKVFEFGSILSLVIIVIYVENEILELKF